MDRYNRQIITIGKDAQKKLLKSHICIVGVGALGTAVAQSLVRSGVGKIKIIDFDIVNLDNLQRQHIYTQKDVGKDKVKAALKYLNDVNSEVKIEAIKDAIDETNLDLLKSDLVLDCTDNFETSYVISDYCKKNKIPLIFGSAIRLEGYVFNQVSRGKTVRELFRGVPTFERCKDVGVMNTITSLIGCVQANEAIKILIGKDFEKKLLRFDLVNNELLKIKV